MKTAQPLDGRQAPLPQFGQQSGHGRFAAHRFTLSAARPVFQPQFRPANRTGVGLGVKTTIQGVFVFAAAFVAQREAGHAGERPIIGNGTGDGVTRTAVGTIGEGVSVTTIGRVHHVGQTGVAHGHVRADQHGVAPVAVARAGGDDESPFIRDHGQRRGRK